MALGVPLDVCGFDAEDEPTAGAPRKEQVIERSPRIAYMKQASRRRSKTDPGDGKGRHSTMIAC